jgi:RNA polymerase sigma-70 factor (ECF subfamily)
VKPEEFDEFYSRSARRLIGALYAMTGDADEARDVVQEAFVRAWSKRRTLAKVDNPEAWVRTVAWRLAVSRWRKNSNAKIA